MDVVKQLSKILTDSQYYNPMQEFYWFHSQYQITKCAQAIRNPYVKKNFSRIFGGHQRTRASKFFRFPNEDLTMWRTDANTRAR